MSCNCTQNSSKCNSSKSTIMGTQCTTLTNACCQGQIAPKFNVAKAKTICCYVDRIFDSGVGPGSALFQAVTTSTTGYTTSITLTNPNVACCTPCAVNSSSVFTVGDCSYSQLSTLVPQTTIPAASVFVNGSPVSSVTVNADGSYTVGLSANNAIPNFDCEGSGQGTRSTLLIKDIGTNWAYTASNNLYGMVNTGGQSCNFNLVFSNTIPQVTDTATSTFMVQNLCIPSLESQVTFTISGEMSLVNTSIVYDTIPIVTTTAVIAPQINVEVVEKTQVCLQAMI